MGNITLQQFLRLIVFIIFEINNKYRYKIDLQKLKGQELYNNLFFLCPRVVCKDGWNCSFQIHNGAYCKSENGYRQIGYTWEYVEFGYTSEHEPLFSEYSEDPENTTSSVGSLPIEVAQKAIDKHGGIDLDTTISEEVFKQYNIIK